MAQAGVDGVHVHDVHAKIFEVGQIAGAGRVVRERVRERSGLDEAAVTVNLAYRISTPVHNEFAEDTQLGAGRQHP